MTGRDRESAQRARPLPGTGCLGLVAGYFQLAGIAAAFVTAGVATAAFFPRLGWTTIPRNPWVALVGGALMTAGFLRTAYLLRSRRKTGGEFALACFLAPLTGYVSGVAPSIWSVGISACGLALVVSVWRQLE
jgi:hypothetical protein